MGVAYKLNCGHCAYNKDVFLGIGFNYISLSSILPWYKVEVGKQRIKEFIHNDKESWFECFDGLYVCRTCCYLLNEVYLEIKSGNNHYTNNYDCPRCLAPMPPTPINEIYQDTLMDCPDCGKEKLMVKPFMDWD